MPHSDELEQTLH